MILSETFESALTIFKQVMEEKLNATHTAVASVQPGQNVSMFTKEKLEEDIKDVCGKSSEILTIGTILVSLIAFKCYFQVIFP